MLITPDFIFHFEGEDVDSKLKETFGENWQEQTANKQRICFKKDSIVSFYLKGRKPKTPEGIFKSFVLGSIFLNEVDSNRNYTLKTCSIPIILATRSCLALSNHLKMPIESFFEEIPQNISNDSSEEDKDSSEGYSKINEKWWDLFWDIMSKFSKNGWICERDISLTSLGMPPEEVNDGSDDDILISLTNIFLVHFDDFEIEQF